LTIIVNYPHNGIMITRVKASWFHIQGYCEYQLYLMVCKKVGNLDTPDTIAGTEAHAVLDSMPGAGEVGISNLADKVYQAQAKHQPFTAREVDVRGARIYGRIDCIEYHLNHVVISDNKPRPKTGVPFYGDQRQIIAYCMAFAAEFPDIQIPIVAKFRDHANKEFWSHEFVEADKKDVNETIDRMLGIINETRDAKPAKEYKCSGCYYLPYCDMAPSKRR